MTDMSRVIFGIQFFKFKKTLFHGIHISKVRKFSVSYFADFLLYISKVRNTKLSYFADVFMKMFSKCWVTQSDGNATLPLVILPYMWDTTLL